MNYCDNFSIYTRMQSLASLIFNISDISDLHVLPELNKWSLIYFLYTQIKNRKIAINLYPSVV